MFEHGCINSNIRRSVVYPISSRIWYVFKYNASMYSGVINLAKFSRNSTMPSFFRPFSILKCTQSGNQHGFEPSLREVGEPADLRTICRWYSWWPAHRLCWCCKWWPPGTVRSRLGNYSFRRLWWSASFGIGPTPIPSERWQTRRPSHKRSPKSPATAICWGVSVCNDSRITRRMKTHGETQRQSVKIPKYSPTVARSELLQVDHHMFHPVQCRVAAKIQCRLRQRLDAIILLYILHARRNVQCYVRFGTRFSFHLRRNHRWRPFERWTKNNGFRKLTDDRSVKLAFYTYFSAPIFVQSENFDETSRTWPAHHFQYHCGLRRQNATTRFLFHRQKATK